MLSKKLSLLIISFAFLFAVLSCTSEDSSKNNSSINSVNTSETEDEIQTVAKPTFNKAGGSYSGTQSISISNETEDSTTCFTTDGTTPVCDANISCTTGQEYTNEISVSFDTSIKAISCKAGMINSEIITVSYDIQIVCPSSFATKADRLFGLDILNTSETGSFNDALTKGKSMGMEFIGVHLSWTNFEDNTGSGATSGNFTDTNTIIKSFIDVVQANNLKFSLTIRPIDLTGKTVPTDLASTRFDNADFQTRFKALINFVLNIKGSDNVTTIQNYLTSLQIGNEIDGYDTSAEHVDFWSHYGDFLFNMTAYVHTINANIKVGYTAMLEGATSESKKAIFQALSNTVDVTGITYYPMDSNFNVLDASVVSADLQKLADTFPGKTIFLQEVGYHTSAVNNSSQKKQSAFFCSFFQAWDAHKDLIKLTNIVRLQDISEVDATDMAIPYGIGADAFKEYLRTLGLRTYPGAGEDKNAIAIIQTETAKRGW